MNATFHALLPLLLILFTLRAAAAPVNVNTADAASLADALTGVGPKTAEAIVGYRDQHGPFRSMEELLNVKGVGPKTLERNRDDILLGETGETAGQPAAD